jgi:hypothetical protein
MERSSQGLVFVGIDVAKDPLEELLLGTQDELDLLPGLLSERRDDLPDRCTLVPPYDEVGCPSVGRRQNDRPSEKDGSIIHGAAS